MAAKLNKPKRPARLPLIKNAILRARLKTASFTFGWVSLFAGLAFALQNPGHGDAHLPISKATQSAGFPTWAQEFQCRTGQALMPAKAGARSIDACRVTAVNSAGEVYISKEAYLRDGVTMAFRVIRSSDGTLAVHLDSPQAVSDAIVAATIVRRVHATALEALPLDSGISVSVNGTKPGRIEMRALTEDELIAFRTPPNL